MKRILKYKFIIIFVMFYALTYLFLPKIWKKIEEVNFSDFTSTIIMFPAIFILLGLIEAWVNKDVMTKLVGDESGWKGNAVSYFLGMIGVGPLYVAFPVAVVLLRKGISIRNVYVFLGAWSTTKIPQLIIEAGSMGIKYTILRLVCNIIGILLIAKIMDMITTKEIKEKIMANIK